MNKAPKLIDQITSDLISLELFSPEAARRTAEVLIRDELLWEDKQILIDLILANADR